MHKPITKIYTLLCSYSRHMSNKKAIIDLKIVHIFYTEDLIKIYRRHPYS